MSVGGLLSYISSWVREVLKLRIFHFPDEFSTTELYPLHNISLDVNLLSFSNKKCILTDPIPAMILRTMRKI